MKTCYCVGENGNMCKECPHRKDSKYNPDTTFASPTPWPSEEEQRKRRAQTGWPPIT